MIHKTILLACFLFAAHFLSAQQFSLGVRGGYTQSDFVVKNFESFAEEGVDPNDDFQSIGGIHIGLESRLEFHPRWALLSGVLYNQKGFLYKDYVAFNSEDVKHVFHYLNVPVIADFNVWRGISLQGGVEAGWLMSARGETSEGSFDLEGFADLYSDFDFGLVAGLEYRLSKAFFIGARYTWGVYNIQDGVEFVDENNNPVDVGSYNRALQISAGYRYTFAE